jgi:5-(carboxyamino)imidazole ribonucleotide synthase
VDGPVLAVLGGGQLGRMLALAAAPLGVRCRFLDPKPDAPAGELGPLVVGSLDDPAALDAVAEGADVATYEWEGVPVEAAEHVARRVPVHPGPAALGASQDRLAEKETMRALGIPTAPYAPASTRRELHDACAEVGLPVIVKTRRGGYDGKGQHVVRTAAEVDAAWDALAGSPLLVEGVVPFRRELSVIATRGHDGTVVTWPLTENVHDGGILRLSRAPAARPDDPQTATAHTYVRALLEHTAYVGTIAIELFDTEDGLVANEFAPRVHNSGHWTIDAAVTSQFENHIRAVLGLPLGATDATGAAAMVNLLGAVPDRHALLRMPGVHLHDYRKAPAPRRKVGHATVVGPTPGAIEPILADLLALARATNQPREPTG